MVLLKYTITAKDIPFQFRCSEVFESKRDAETTAAILNKSYQYSKILVIELDGECHFKELLSCDNCPEVDSCTSKQRVTKGGSK